MKTIQGGFLLVVGLIATPISAASIYSQTLSAGTGGTTPIVLTFTGAPQAATDATLTLTATGGELANNGKRLESLTVDGDTYETAGQPAGWILPANFLSQSLDPVDPITIPLAALAGYVVDGEVVVSVTKPNFVSGAVFDLTLEYTSAIPEPTALWLLAGVAGAATRRLRA